MAGNPNSGRKAKPPLEVSEGQRSLAMYNLGGLPKSNPGGVFDIKGQGGFWSQDVASSDYGKAHRAAEKGYKKQITKMEARRRSPHGYRHMTATDYITKHGT